MNLEKVLRSRWFWIILVICLLWFGGMTAIGIESTQGLFPDGEARTLVALYLSIFSLFGLLIFFYFMINFPAGLIYWITHKVRSIDYNALPIIIAIVLWMAFIVFLVKLKKIKKQWLIRILIILLLIALMSIWGCSHIKSFMI